MADFKVIVPSRSRPWSVRDVAQAFHDTGAEGVDLVYVVDADDDRYPDYFNAGDPGVVHPCQLVTLEQWQPLVPKLNAAALQAASNGTKIVMFMGDDHRPRTSGWPQAIREALAEPGVHIVYGPDGHQNESLPTWWAMSGALVRALGKMVPAPVEHLYCDNAVLVLGDVSETIRYLPRVLVEHLHPVAGKAEWDDQYRRVNRVAQYERDSHAFHLWATSAEFRAQVEIASTLG